jgi:hypothetical protein
VSTNDLLPRNASSDAAPPRSDLSADQALEREIARDMGWIAPSACRQRRESRHRRQRAQKLLTALAALTRLPFRWMNRCSRRVLSMLAQTARRLLLPAPQPASTPDCGDRLPRSRFSRWSEALAIRGLIGMLVLVIGLLAAVQYTTRPTHLIAAVTPESVGLGYRPIALHAADDSTLSAWFIPALSPDDLLPENNRILPTYSPGALLVHADGDSQTQYLSLARLLHDRGVAVLLLDCRGQGESAPVRRTLGLRETDDVVAAAAFLQSSPMIDPNRLALIGGGDAALAVLRAAAQVHPAFTVLDGPPPNASANAQRLLPTCLPAAAQWGYRAMFSVVIQAPLEDLDLPQLLATVPSPTLLIVRPEQSITDRSALTALNSGPTPPAILFAQPALLPGTLAAADETTVAQAVIHFCAAPPATASAPPARRSEGDMAGLLSHEVRAGAR